MVQLATAAELASELGIDLADLDQGKADRKLASASAAVESMTGMAFTTRTATLRLPGSAALELALPVRPVRQITAVSIGGRAYTDFRLTATGALWRARGWRTVWGPETVEITVEYGLTAIPDDIKGLVLEMAADTYDGRVVMESIDDYRVQYADGGGLSAEAARTLAAYGGGAAALAMRTYL
ncbi:hypothetical protein [Actinoplanes rectilineatus]|uniref:hypothetical protein n=1 Tax=Actinoplanes rectilineatus TaxID=113571 RepID=UPI0005F28655|nr:hypothetical protein [Actinoplanes rectilineatus]